MEYKGMAVSKGVAIGTVYHYASFDEEACLAQLALMNKEESPADRFSAAVAEVKAELYRMSRTLTEKSPEQAGILNAHIEIAEDEALLEDVETALEEGLPLGEAVIAVFGQYIELFSQSREERIRERVADLTDVRNRILQKLAGWAEKSLSALPGPCIVVAQDLLPADTATIDRKNVLAIVTEIGGDTSHTSIIARSYGIPCIVGVAGITSALEEGQTIIVDAMEGKMILAPNDEEQAFYREKQEQFARQKEENERYRRQKATTTDGTNIDICVNLAHITPEALETAEYADGVGLFRTEFLYMGRTTPPSEEEQLAVYRQVLSAFSPKPVIIRTLDIGGDKKVDCLTLPQEQNPFLGQRALRLCFAQQDIFRTQLRAALRASSFGTLWIMFPMVGSLEDFQCAKAILEEERQLLEHDGFSVAKNVRIGAMIEIPAMALCAGHLAQLADFASIGSNDLTQYLLAVDRTEPSVAQYCQKYHPAVLQAIAMAAKAFVRVGKPIGICGELGGDVLAAPLLAGFGMSELSMSSGAMAEVKKSLCRHSMAECRELAGRVLMAATAGEAETLLREFDQQE